MPLFLGQGTRDQIALEQQNALALQRDRYAQELEYQKGLLAAQEQAKVAAQMGLNQRLKDALSRHIAYSTGTPLEQAQQQASDMVDQISTASPTSQMYQDTAAGLKAKGYIPGAEGVGSAGAMADQWDQIARKAAAQTNIATSDAQRISAPQRINMENLAATNAADLAARTSARRFNSAPEAAYQQDVASALGNQNQGLQFSAQMPFMPDVGKTTAQAQLAGNKANIAKNTLQQQTMEQVRPDLAAAAENNQARATSATAGQVANAPLLGVPGLASNPMMISILQNAINNAQQQPAATNRLAYPGAPQRRTLGQLPGYNLGGPQ